MVRNFFVLVLLLNDNLSFYYPVFFFFAVSRNFFLDLPDFVSFYSDLADFFKLQPSVVLKSGTSWVPLFLNFLF